MLTELDRKEKSPKTDTVEIGSTLFNRKVNTNDISKVTPWLTSCEGRALNLETGGGITQGNDL